MSEYLRLSAGGYAAFLPREAIASGAGDRGLPALRHWRFISAPRLVGAHIDARRPARVRVWMTAANCANLVRLETACAWKPIRTVASSVSSIELRRTALKPMIRTRFKPCCAVLPF